jgi:hypothetical protein
MKSVQELRLAIKHGWRRRWVWRLYPKQDGPKIFVIGYLKTGTSSVGTALKMLGFRHTSFNNYVWLQLYKTGKIDKVLDFAKRFQSFDDRPWLEGDFLPVLNQTFPNSKFIYLTRDEASWKRSWTRWNLWFNNMEVDADEGWAAYQRHEALVLAFLRHEVPNENQITLQVNDPSGFQKLADFLDMACPQDAFPKVNVTPP